MKFRKIFNNTTVIRIDKTPDSVRHSCQIIPPVLSVMGLMVRITDTTPLANLNVFALPCGADVKFAKQLMGHILTTRKNFYLYFAFLVIFNKMKDLFTLFVLISFLYGHDAIALSGSCFRPPSSSSYAILTPHDLADPHVSFGNDLLNYPVYELCEIVLNLYVVIQ